MVKHSVQLRWRILWTGGLNWFELDLHLDGRHNCAPAGSFRWRIGGLDWITVVVGEAEQQLVNVKASREQDPGNILFFWGKKKSGQCGHKMILFIW